MYPRSLNHPLKLCVALAMILGCSANPYSQCPARLNVGGDVHQYVEQLVQRCRRPEPARTPEWVNAIPNQLADILLEKHLHRRGPVWGTAKADPQQELPYDEMGSATFLNLVRQFDLFDKIGGWDDKARQEALKYWQGWQDPGTGRFRDPRDSNRTVNEKYVVGLIRSLGGEPLYPWTTTGTEKRIETDVFLRRTKADPDWQRGGWGVGSHTGFMAVEIFEAVNGGQTELIPDLRTGIERILTHQDQESGLWGPPSAELLRRMGGTLKIIGRLYFKMGTTVPHTCALADTLIENHRNGNLYAEGCGDNPCLAATWPRSLRTAWKSRTTGTTNCLKCWKAWPANIVAGCCLTGARSFAGTSPTALAFSTRRCTDWASSGRICTGKTVVCPTRWKADVAAWGTGIE